MMFLGEALCLPLFYILMRKQSFKEANQDTQRISPFIFALPCLMEILATLCMFIGLTQVLGSVYGMTRSSVIAFAIFKATIFFKRKFFRHHWTSICLTVLGVFLVGLGSHNFKVASLHSGKTSLGVIMLLIGQAFVSAKLTTEEKILKDKEQHPLVAVGWQGVFGFVISLILLPVFQVVDCSYSVCSNGKVEDSMQAF